MNAASRAPLSPSAAPPSSGTSTASRAAFAASVLSADFAFEAVAHGTPETAPRRRIMGHEIQCLMHAFGEVRYCAGDVLEIVEDMVRAGVRRFAEQVAERYDGQVTGVAVAGAFRTDVRALRRLGKMLEISAREHPSEEMQQVTDTVQRWLLEEEWERQERPCGRRGCGATRAAPIDTGDAEEAAAAAAADLRAGPAWLLRLTNTLPTVEWREERVEEGEREVPQTEKAPEANAEDDTAESRTESDVPAADAEVSSAPDSPMAVSQATSTAPARRLHVDTPSVDSVFQRPPSAANEDPTLMPMYRADYVLKQCMPRIQYTDFVACRNVRFTHGESRSRPGYQRMVLFREWLHLGKLPQLTVTDDGLHALGHVAWELTGLITQSALLLRHYDDLWRGHGDCRAMCWSAARHLLAALGNGIATAVIVPMTVDEYMALRREVEMFELTATPGQVVWRGLSDHAAQCLQPWQVREVWRRLHYDGMRVVHHPFEVNRRRSVALVGTHPLARCFR